MQLARTLVVMPLRRLQTATQYYLYKCHTEQVTGNLQAVQNGLAAICNQLRINPGKAWSEPLSVSFLIGSTSSMHYAVIKCNHIVDTA